MADPHDDGCRCQGCCAAKFKKLDPAVFGKAPQLPEGDPWPHTVQRCNHTLYDARCWLAPLDR